MNSIIDQLLKLQTAQLDHDEFFHKEITRLTVHQRLNHMTLHFAKYSGKICNFILNSSDEQALKKTVIDSFIISITCANALNLRVSDKLIIGNTQEISSLSDLGHIISKNYEINVEDPLWLVKTYPIVVGELAKACESVDHLESYQYREAIAGCVIRICSLMLAAASHLNIDIATEVLNRLTGVKEKSIFFDHYISLRT